jgi:hypothetical protein
MDEEEGKQGAFVWGGGEKVGGLYKCVCCGITKPFCYQM